MPQPTVETIEGRLGGGKTLFAMERVARRLGEGGTVVTNIEVKREGLKKFVRDEYEVEFEDDQLRLVQNREEVAKIWEHAPIGTQECNTLIVVDEAHTVWRRGSTRRGDESPVVTFVTLARKTWTDCIFIAPSLSSVDSQLSDYNHYTYRLRDMQRLSLFGVRYPFPQVNRCRYDGAGQFLIDNELVMRDKRLFETYDTYHIVKAVGRLGVTEKRRLRKVNKNKKMKLILIVLVLVAGLLYGIRHFDGKYKEGEKRAVRSESVEQSRKRQVKPGHVGPVFPVVEKVRMVVETLRGLTEGVCAKSDVEEYTIGDVCSRGRVVAMSGRTVRVDRPDGGTDYVLLRDGQPVRELRSSSSVPAAVPVPSAAVVPSVQQVRLRQPTWMDKWDIPGAAGQAPLKAESGRVVER